MKEVRYMISDASDMLGMEAHVLRYWEEELELEIPRNEMGHRYYTEEWLETFRQIRRMKEQGYQLRAIKMVLHNQNQHGADLLMSTAVTEMEISTMATAKMEQFQAMMTNIVKTALAENNQELGQAVSEHVGARVLKEMNYLMREREEQEEARFRKLDETLRMRQKGLKWKRKKRFGRKSQKNEQEQAQVQQLSPSLEEG